MASTLDGRYFPVDPLVTIFRTTITCGLKALSKSGEPLSASIGEWRESKSVFIQSLHSAHFLDVFSSRYRYYPHGLRWFLLATVFAEAGANAFTVLAVVFLDDQLGMSGTQIGVVFLTTLVASVPGAKLGSFITAKTNPNTSLKINLVLFSVVTFAGAFALSGPERAYLAYVFGVFWGVILGWFYSTENLFFSMVLPKGQEAELTGFFVYCTQILVWLPPLVFTAMIEAGVSQSWGLVSLITFFAIAVILLMFVAPWTSVLEESAKPINAELVKVEGDEEVTSKGDVTEEKP